MSASASAAAQTTALRGRAAANILANLAGYALTAGVAFLIWPLEVHRLGDRAFGLWALLGQLIAYAAMLDFGVRIAVMRYMARAQARRDAEASARLISTAFVLMLAPAMVVLGAGVWAAYALPARLQVGAALLAPARIAILLTAATVALGAPGALFNGCVAAVSRYDLMNLRNAAVQILRGLLLWYFLVHGYGLVAVAAIFLATEQLGQGLDLYFSWRHCVGLRVSWRHFDPALVKELVNFGAYAFLITVAVRVVYWSDNVVVGFMAGSAAVAYYAVAGSLAQYLRDGVTNFTRVFAPWSAQLDALGEHAAQQRLFLNGSRLGMVAILPGALFLLLGGHEFLRLWMGPAMAQRATRPLILLVIAAATTPIAAMYTNVLYATARHRVCGLVAMGEAAANLGLSIYLIRSIGISGVAVGTLVPAVVVQLVVMPAYTCRVLQAPLLPYLREALGRPLLAALPAAILGAWALECGWLRGWPRLLAAGASLCIVYFAAAAAVALSAGERKRVAAAMRRRWRARRAGSVGRPAVAD